MVSRLDNVKVMLYDEQRIACITESLKHCNKLGNILRMKSCGRLVKYIQSFSRSSSCKLGCKLDSLSLAAREGGRGLSDLDISKTDVVNGLQLILYPRNSVKEAKGFLYRHLKDICDILSLVFDLKRVAVISVSVADVTGNVNVGQEVHLYLLDAISLARLTATALDVKGKSSRLIALCLGISGACKEIANITEKSRVGCGI